MLRNFCAKLAREKPEVCRRIDEILSEAGIPIPRTPKESSHQATKPTAAKTSTLEDLDRLLRAFDDLIGHADKQGRGYQLQDLLTELLTIEGVDVQRSFTRNEGGEQIDGAFKLEGWHYIVECRWRKKLANIRELDGLHGQLDRSGKQTMGVFLSINGWSDNVPLLLKQSPAKSIILMEGVDLRSVLSGALSFSELTLSKAAKLNLEGEPYHRVSDILRDRNS
ncbi:restriction endonuclease [Myxococcus sp. AS-1-15]|uniref:restriction endonuclease n=1 Tax=Myxococcus sp. AS-1-15 TaxID=2874600 RepID=UPI001CBD9B94|nr:restriction endonuclease [Myxococcus sp. AS-1-15]MBZ4396630.1 restriction endonuclease [Myxococcus sp. AS-1-15]